MSTEIALVTGAGSGIGAAVARRLGERGAHVIALDRSARGLGDLASHFDDLAGSVEIHVADVTDDGRWTEIAASAAAVGALRTVVACAGIDTRGEVTSVSLEDWTTTISVNLNGVFLTARHTVPLLIAAGGGTFTAISSDAGVFGAQGYAAYCASKHGVVGLVKCMALDHAPSGVRSNVICPGFVNTPMAERLLGDIPDSERQFWSSNVPLGRFAEPREIANAVAYLSSQEASYVNGAIHMMDGGASAGTFAS